MKYLIVGASASSLSCAKTLRKLDKDSVITIVSKDEQIYSRCILHHYISNHKTIDEINFTEENFFEKYNINWIKGKEVKKIDISNKNLILNDSSSLFYDKLFIGSGASSFIPPIKNLRDGKNIYGLRNIEDAIKIKELAKSVKNVIILGAGLVGIDAAIGLLNKNLNISIVEMGNKILPMQLDEASSLEYEKLFIQNKVNIIKNVKATEVILDENNYVKKLCLDNNVALDCDLIIVATGVKPNTDFIDNETIKIEKGICINEKCETSVKDIYAGGDVTGVTPIWPIAVKQGIVAAYNMTNNEKILDDLFAIRNSMNFLNLETVSVGNINPIDDTFNIFIRRDKNSYKKIVHKDGIIYGALLQGDISYCGVLTKLIKEKINISHINKDIFDIDYSDFYNVKENGEYHYCV